MRNIYKKLLTISISVLYAGLINAQCDNGAVPFTENFDAVTAPALPPCVIVENTNGDGRAWTLLQGIFSGSSSPNIITYTTNPSVAANDWFFIKGINLTGGVSYALTFRYLGTANKPEKIEVRAGTAPTSVSVLAGPQIFNKTDITAVGTGSGTFTPTVTGIYYFGFHIYSDANQNVAAIDNITVDLVPPLPNCTTNISPANGATNVNIPPTLTWNTVPGATSYDLFLSTNGTTYTNVGNYITSSASIAGAAGNTTYYWYVAPRNSAGIPTTCQSTATSFVTTANLAPNDSCGASILLSSGVAVNSTTINSTSSLPPVTCGSSTATSPTGDVWFRFVATYNGAASVSVTNAAGSFDPVLVVYSGAPVAGCGGLTYITCSDVSGGGSGETVNLASAVAGITYYVRVYGFLAGNANTFTIQVSGTALPVTLVNLKGERSGTSNKITWTTMTEQNNNGFELLRSVEGSTFGTLGFVNSKSVNGSSTAALNYEFHDLKPFTGNSYYKLKQIDKDGRETNTNTILVKGVKATSLQLLGVFPNPASSTLNVYIGAPAAQSLKIIISDVAGKIVMQQTKQVSAGDNKMPLSISDLFPGNYFIRLVCDNGCESATSKFSKQ